MDNGMTQILISVRDVLWGPFSIILLVGTGVWFTIGTGFLQIKNFPQIWKTTVVGLFKKNGGGKDGISPFQAVSTALAGTMGTGNIAGIATALVAGGPGAVFWMWVSSFFGMMTKYAEVSLAVKYRKRKGDGSYYGGPMVYIKEGLGNRWLASVFAFCCVLASLGIGNATQIHSAAASLHTTFRVPLFFTGLLGAILTAMVIMGGIKRIGKVAESVIPLISIFYIIGGSAVLWVNRANLLPAFDLILGCAVAPQAVLGGVGGYTMSAAMRTGVSRGVFSNEAGLGSAPIAHASANASSPKEQGYWGIFEVFVDTIVVCTFTALIILSVPQLWQSGLNGAELTTTAFTLALGHSGGWIVSLSLALFSLATLFCWAYYGERGVSHLTNGSGGAILLYRVVFVVVVAVAPMVELELVWIISDILNGLMAIPNMIALVFLSSEVFELSKTSRHK